MRYGLSLSNIKQISCKGNQFLKFLSSEFKKFIQAEIRIVDAFYLLVCFSSLAVIKDLLALLDKRLHRLAQELVICLILLF